MPKCSLDNVRAANPAGVAVRSSWSLWARVPSGWSWGGHGPSRGLQVWMGRFLPCPLGSCPEHQGMRAPRLATPCRGARSGKGNLRHSTFTGTAGGGLSGLWAVGRLPAKGRDLVLCPGPGLKPAGVLGLLSVDPVRPVIALAGEKQCAREAGRGSEPLAGWGSGTQAGSALWGSPSLGYSCPCHWSGRACVQWDPAPWALQVWVTSLGRRR